MPNDEIYQDMVQPSGPAYRSDRIQPWSHYREPINTEDGHLHGESRRWGDATPQTQSRVIDTLIQSSRDAGLSARETAYVLAIARVESGFNPDAAAGTTSAAGLGQFIDRTGRAYDLNAGNRFDVQAQSDGLVRHFVDNRDLARSRGQGEAYIYKYHHDGPSRDYGGLGLSNREVMPHLDAYERFVNQRLGQTREHPQGAHPQQAAATTAQTPAARQHPGFQRTMETMLPSQGHVDAHVTGQYGEHRQGHRTHGGTDFNYEGGQTGINRQHPIVHSPVAGTVTFSGGQYGTVKIRDAQGHSHEVLHLDSCSVTAGQVIAAGDPIGRMGGRGPGGASDYDQHVHYQLRDPQGRLISPQTFWDQGRQQPADGQRHVGGGQDALRHGDHGPQVLALQHALNRQGIGDRHGHRLAEDGRFGDNTRDAVKAFQRRHGLEADGVVGKDTRGALAGQHQDQTFGARPSGQRLGPNDPHHPDSALHAALKRQLPDGISEQAAAHVTAQAKLHGIDSPGKLQGVLVQDGKAFVMGTTPGFRATIDLSQAPSVEQSNQLLLANQAGALAQERAPAVAVGPR